LVAAIAALFLAIVSIGLWRHLTQVSSVTEELTHQGEIIPGTQTATLTLADGKKIKLIDAQSGVLEEETGGLISKNADGTLVYKEIEGHIVSSGYNTLSTARGETYKVQLPDGTQVWLNASSTIRYAASFKGRAQRYIELEGEAYFDVAKDKNHPFVVKTSTQEVEVLGTRFNINSYADEVAVNTTLLEGTVQINYQDKKTLLHPGQQANLSVAGTLQINMVDTDPIISWINNEFMFDGDDIETVMRKISRWYNVDVVYIGARTREKFGGGLSRFEEVGQVLAMLEKTGAVRFKVEGKTIYVRAA
jgi:ferric-dicitrate binding protein FerR (iron transport regulator)